MPPPASHQQSKDQSQTPLGYATPTDVPPPHWHATPQWCATLPLTCHPPLMCHPHWHANPTDVPRTAWRWRQRSTLAFVAKSLVCAFDLLQEMGYECHLVGTGGFCEVEVPLNRWGDRMWFRVALSVVSLNDDWLKQLLPGNQDFSHQYSGKTWTSLFICAWVRILRDCWTRWQVPKCSLYVILHWTQAPSSGWIANYRSAWG